MTVQSYHWKELPGNPYLFRFDPGMLSPDGCSMVKFGHPPGSRYGDTRVAFSVLYDREFVIKQWRYFLNPYLECLESDEIMALIQEAMELKQ